ncbi:CD276 antigen-like isoform X3 [Oreochromis aureus]|uniref:CD276 antigen-like isoform X3 n=1 Tax=Oreochromis aureus TaxID=47969 RepID=UPI001953193A|nr:CD276 antigen-like isoform X3 [Oreochromis aureus]
MHIIIAALFVVIVIVLLIPTISRGDAKVSCVFKESCILPCSFQGDIEEDPYIHWMHLSEGHPLVYLHYDNKEQLTTQDQQFRNRTSLFKDQLSRGNASLQLAGVQVLDEGRYSCYISTDNREKESFIDLEVHSMRNQSTPVKVSIQHVGNRITCSSEGIYPEPELTWSTRPPSKVSFKNTTTVEQTKQQLYNINGSLIASLDESDRVYSCTVSTQRNRRRASLRQLQQINGSDLEATISCSSSNTSLMSLIWRFNHSQIIVSRSGPSDNYTVSERWKQHVKGVSESGNLILKYLSSDQDGIYSCEISDADETVITETCMRISEDNSAKVGVTIGVVSVLALFLILCCKKKKDVLTDKLEDK